MDAQGILARSVPRAAHMSLLAVTASVPRPLRQLTCGACGKIEAAFTIQKGVVVLRNLGWQGLRSFSIPLVRSFEASRKDSLGPKRGLSSAPQAVLTAPTPKVGANPEMAKQQGYEVISEQFIDEYNSTAILYRHKKTGAEIMSVSNSDEKKVFGIVFRTPAQDSLGIPHILQRSVMCGSRKYPLKNPVGELFKSSLDAYAKRSMEMDRTCFRVASTNLQDFYNLVDVHLDAVFSHVV
ncbi:hypothetical protein MARPO_0138s0035 [Marchantia polymorpha]|uniref:Uncharacterized protein n=1 Tax=Marchantia polymorpha TaxID=3197 RepID=A0A2R6W6W7_MARPO|nr:hypothetical protein MARPO_0138s0035 [Marchantia polymorpha]|eukprot:PTQ29600.1 hypothetical protein MARPO_0138s0035 [Marchantia polymorpha]